ncbi:MAG: spore maturation protein [Clostridiales bacterium]|jgi:spore maturation protein B|nr:spore maturation protein [Clostridiales bacterium]
MEKFGSYLVPVLISLILLFGFVKKVPLFDTFLDGAKEGLKSTVSIAPALIGLITAVSMLKASGALDIFTAAIRPVAAFLGLPPEVMPLTLLRPVSGSGSIAILDHIFSTCGPDSFAGRVASVMMGSTETTFYAVAVYFGAVGIKKTRHTIPAAVTADMASFLISALAVRLFFPAA